MKKKNILMIVEYDYPADSRVRKEASALKQYYSVSVIALKKRRSEKMHEVLDDIRVYRIPTLPDLGLGKLQYVIEYAYFTVCAAFIFLCTYPLRRYKVIHAHNPPDTLFFVGLLGKLFCAKFVYDHHDLSPELYLARFSGKKDFLYKLLIFFEKMNCRLASVIISTNESYKAIEIKRHHVAPDKIFVVRNNPVISECRSHGSVNKGANGKKVLLYAGSINPQDGVDVLLKAIHHLVFDLRERNFTCCVLGNGDSLQAVKDLAVELNVEDYVDFTGFVYDRGKVKEYLAAADICVEPAPDNELNRHSTFIKVMEYMAAGKPTVAFDLKETRYSANGSAILIQPNDIQGLAKAVKQLMDNPELRIKLGKTGMDKIEKEFNWNAASLNLKQAYKTLWTDGEKAI